MAAQPLVDIFSYMRAFAPEMGERIIESYPPLHSPADAPSARIKDLLRKPLPAQELAIMGTAKYLKNHHSAKIVAECGTGKTLMSMATCYVHSEGHPFTALYMVPPHLTKKTAREVFLTIPNARVFLIEDMRNGGDKRKPHGVVEVMLKNGEIERKGAGFSLSELRHMGRKGWKKYCGEKNAFFVLSKEKGKLGYFWRDSYQVAKSGKELGGVVNVDTGRPVEISNGGYLTRLHLHSNKKYKEMVSRHAEGTTFYSPMWSADRSKIQRMAPLEYMSRFMKDWFDYAIADELHQLSGDTAQGNGLGVLERIGRKLIGLTGTMMGGYADDLFNVFFRMDAPQVVAEGYEWGAEGRKLFQSTYGVSEEIVRHEEKDNACSKTSKANVTIKRRPGCSPCANRIRPLLTC